ncbi:MAG: NAD-dependent DNA ligase LigA [Candidatus Hodarchaeales archaeon]
MHEIEDLVNEILYHKKKYYSGEPEISDEEYDKLENRLRDLDPENPVLFMIGTPEGGEVIHEPVMLSCQKVKTVDEVVKWAGKKPLFVGYKVDGLSLKVVYDEGRLVQAATRGNGSKGEDVTVNIMKIAALPKIIPLKRKIEVRGELFMKISEFNRINSGLSESKYTSPRNLAVGTLKQKDIKQLEKRTLDFMAWDLIDRERKASIEEITSELRDWGFDISDFLLVEEPDRDRIATAFKEVQDTREKLDFEIDGVVFKYNNYEDRIKAGSTEHHPKWQIALKFPGKGETTEVKSITWQVGRTGVLTPVAELEPVKVAGAVIKRATLHNADFLESLGINAGDTVMVERSGDVIPKITGIIEKTGEKTRIVDECPSCGSPVVREGVNLVCCSKYCRERDIQRIIHWIKITDIEGLGPKSVEKLYNEGLLRHYSDLYSLKKEQLVNLLGRNGAKIHNNIEKTRILPFHLFLAAMGIEKLGKKMGKVLAGYFSTFEHLKEATIDQLTAIENISDLTASYIQNGVNQEENYNELFQNGLRIKYARKKDTTASKGLEPGKEVQTLKVYVTGKIQDLTKKEIQQLVEDDPHYEWSKSVSKNLAYLVVGEKPGKKKLEKAADKGITVISWDEFSKKLQIN